MSAAKQLILDINVIIDLWLQENSWAETEGIFLAPHSGKAQLWIVASSLPTLEYVAKRAFKAKGLDPEVVPKITSNLIKDLLQQVSVLSIHGFEQAEIFERATDFEDAQIAAACRSLGLKNACVVTEDKTFDTLGETRALSPAQALAWISQASDEVTHQSPIAFIDLATQQTCIRPQLERGIETVLRHGQYIMGPEVRQLEERLAQYVGAKHCITVASGTEALLISLMALGIKPGDEIITTPFTFVATAEVIVLLGAIPVFVDIEPDTGNIDASKIEAAITPRTKAIMPVSLYGQPADMDEINAIAASHGNLAVIEDAAQSFGAEYKGRKSCNLSTFGCTSFFPSKPLGCYGDGGAIFTSDDALAQACREIRVHGQSKRYVHTRIGVGGRMDTLQCAVVLAKLDRFDWEVAQRRSIGERYNQLLDKQGIKRVVQRNDRTSVFAQYTIFTNDRDQLQKQLNDAGIPTAVHYPVPLNEQPAYKHLCSRLSPVAQQLAKQVMSLPMSAELMPEHQQHIMATLVA